MTREEDIIIWILEQFDKGEKKIPFAFFLNNKEYLFDETSIILSQLSGKGIVSPDIVRSTHNGFERPEFGEKTLKLLIEKRQREIDIAQRLEDDRERKVRKDELAIEHAEQSINKIRFDRKTVVFTICLATASFVVSVISLFMSFNKEQRIGTLEKQQKQSEKDIEQIKHRQDSLDHLPKNAVSIPLKK